MKSVIYKYPITDMVQSIPVGDVVLVAQQGDSTLPTLWVRHSQDTILAGDYANKDTYTIVGTGNSFDNDGFAHVGSCVCGDFVWHVYRMP